MKPGTTAAPLKSGYIVIVLVFFAITAFNFQKPFGFFRESNPALVAITSDYWKAHPDFASQHIPLYSYAFDAHQPPSTQFDITITTFGYGWFVLPYYFSRLTGLEAGPVMLRIYSLLMLAITMWVLVKTTTLLLPSSPKRSFTSLVVFAFYLFAPVVSWYQVYGYVHETAVLPFYYFTWYSFLRYRNSASIKWLLLTAATLAIGVQFDWLPVIQAGVISIYLLLRHRNKTSFLLPSVAILAGVGYIIYHYASWSSLHDYLQFMRWKFGTRTVGEKGPTYISFLPPNLNLILFYGMSYGMLVLIAIYGALKNKMPWLISLMIITGLIHHLVFWGFSSEHDYATVKMAYPIAFIAAVAISNLRRKVAVAGIVLIIASLIAQYILLHQHRRAGIYQDPSFLYKAGTTIRNIPAGTVVFLNSENKYFPQVEFYAKRPYKMAESKEDALLQMRPMKTDTAVYLESVNGHIVITPLQEK